jgi:hypothetical protein
MNKARHIAEDAKDAEEAAKGEERRGGAGKAFLN